MATTRIMPLHAGKGRTVGKAISDIIDYVKNPEKTDHGRLITSYQCDSRVADAQFLLDKQTYASRTGRVRGKDDVIAYATILASEDRAKELRQPRSSVREYLKQEPKQAAPKAPAHKKKEPER